MAKEYIWAIGDIHGYSASLEAILHKIKEFQTKKVIFLGDYIDRGPNPKEVLDLVMSYQGDKITLLGDHEMLLLNSIEGEDFKPDAVLEWSKHGYDTTLKAFEAKDVDSLSKVMDKKYFEFLNNLQLFHIESYSTSKKNFNILFSHAGPFVDYPVDEQLMLKNFVDLMKYMKDKQLKLEDICLNNSDKSLQKGMAFWDNYLYIHGHIRTQYRHNRNRLQYGSKEKEYNYDLSDIPNPLYYPGGAAVFALDVDTGVDIGGKLSAIGFCEDNIDFAKGKIVLKVIQVDSSRRSKNVSTVVYDLSLPFTDEVSWFTNLMRRLFKKKKKKKAESAKHDPHAHGHGHVPTHGHPSAHGHAPAHGHTPDPGHGHEHPH
jgi:serine/threonine protein phosphatase 1